MKREYSINENEWELIFHTPLMTDGNDVVNGLVPTTIQTSALTFGDSKGVYVNGQRTSPNAAIEFILSDDWIARYDGAKEYYSEAEINYSYVNGVSICTSFIPYTRLCSFAKEGGNPSQPMGIPYNTSVKLMQIHTFADDLSFTSVLWNSYNDQQYTASYAYNPSLGNRKWIQIASRWSGSSQYYRGYIKDFKIYRKK